MALPDSEKIRRIDHITRVQQANTEDEEGDRHLASMGYAMEAITAVLDDTDSPILRQFLEAEA